MCCSRERSFGVFCRIREDAGRHIASQMRRHEPIRLRFDRGTLLLIGLGPGQVQEFCGRSVWTWNTPARLNISDSDGFRSHLPSPDEFDSSLERSLAENLVQRVTVGS
ncbi:MAG: hypothetical protein CEE38_15750 [Planctomycetes bacterium B3_Pla]|nr:MAG: hypothetical protein CEE38_15750 [Planctomycetes bacterium B3_Pla]